MADTYLIANAPYGATDVLLTPSAASGAATTTSSGGIRRRNQGKAGPGQDRRTVQIRWAYHQTITGEPNAAAHLTPAAIHATGETAVAVARTITVTATTQPSTRTRVTPPPVRVGEDEDELLLLDLL